MGFTGHANAPSRRPLTSRASTRPQYLAFLLGWPPPPAGAYVRNANPHPRTVPPALLPRLDALVEADRALYARGLAQLDRQLAALARRRGGPLAAARHWAERAAAATLWRGGRR
jgi:hypothetical protein